MLAGSGDLIDALTELAGVTITVRHPLNPAAMRLMTTLGVTVVIDPRAEPCYGFLGAWDNCRVSDKPCPECAAVEVAA